MQNSKQQSPGLYGANVQNHLRNVNPIANPIPNPITNPIANPSPLAPQNSQPHGQQEMNVSPLTSDIMASIAQRASQLHQQNLYKTAPMPQIHPQQQVSLTLYFDRMQSNFIEIACTNAI